jgi:hypothetical protein
LRDHDVLSHVPQADVWARAVEHTPPES